MEAAHIWDLLNQIWILLTHVLRIPAEDIDAAIRE